MLPMRNIKLDRSIPLVSAEKNFFMIMIISTVTLDLSKLLFYSNWENCERRDGETCGDKSGKFSPTIDTVSGFGLKSN